MLHTLRLTFMSLGIMAIAVLVSACGGGEATPVPESARVTMEEVINQVETDRPRGSGTGPGIFAEALIGQDLIVGDAVKTFVDSEAKVDIVIGDSARFARTTSNTVWRLGQFALDQDTIIELDRGKIFTFDSGPQDDHRPLHIETPAGTATVRGTWMSVSYDPETGVVVVNCFRGACELANALGLVLLTEGQKASATAQTTPAEPQPMEEADNQEFIELPEVKRREIEIPTPQAPLATAPPTEEPTPTATATPDPTPTAPPAPTASPATPPAPAAAVNLPPAAEVLETTVAAMEEVSSFHMELDAKFDVVISGIPTQIPYTFSADYQAPDRMKGKGSVSVPPFFSIESELVIIGDTTYEKNSSTGSWTTTTAPGTVVGDPLDLIRVAGFNLGDLEPVGEETLDGVVVRRLAGLADTGAIEGLQGGLRIEMWVGAEDGLLRRLTLSGEAVLDGAGAIVPGADEVGNPQIEITINFSRYNEPVSIEPPI